ncbi:NAD-dependent epimerase/dehydratase family protein, partial [bacterium]|nr:NAD-dependent epimerase/dehydratase family protein [bacterium]
TFERIIFLSSASVYGLSEHTNSFKESDPLIGETHYAKEKILLEQEIKNICQNRDALFNILRISGMYASKKSNWKKDNLIDQISQSICSSQPRTWEITDYGTQIRDFCSLEFLRLAIKKIIDLNFDNNCTLNLSSTDPIQLKIALNLISKKHKYLSFELRQKINAKIHNSLDCTDFYTKFPELKKSKKTLEQLVDEITNA